MFNRELAEAAENKMERSGQALAERGQGASAHSVSDRINRIRGEPQMADGKWQMANGRWPGNDAFEKWIGFFSGASGESLLIRGAPLKK